MSASLIINARDRLSWRQRLLSDGATAVMWGIWLKLWLPLVRAFLGVPHLDALARRSLRMALVQGPAHRIEHYALALVATSGSLLLWSRLPAFREAAPAAPTARDYAEHFGIGERELLAGRDCPVCVVHHDAQGRVIRIEARAARAT